MWLWHPKTIAIVPLKIWVTITNLVIILKFKICEEFIKCDMTNTKWANAFKIKSKSANRLARLRIVTNVQFAKTIVSAKWNKGKSAKKTRYTGTFDAFLLKRYRFTYDYEKWVKGRYVVHSYVALDANILQHYNITERMLTSIQRISLLLAVVFHFSHINICWLISHCSF